MAVLENIENKILYKRLGTAVENEEPSNHSTQSQLETHFSHCSLDSLLLCVAARGGKREVIVEQIGGDANTLDSLHLATISFRVLQPEEEAIN